jgi:virginiamycin B lyase
VTTVAPFLSPVPLLAAMLVASLVAVPPALAQSSGSAFVYWANTQSGTIGRGTSDGNPANVNQSFIRADSSGVGSLVLDRQHIYWSNFGTKIGRADLDGSGINQSFITLPPDPVEVSALAVDGQHIYWSNTGSGTIGRANLDGSDVRDSFITGANHPAGLAVDGQYIYWSNTGSSTIGRANLDGSGINQSFITTPNGGPAGLAVDGGHIYWTGVFSTTIARASLDGSNVNPSFITGAIGAFSVAVDYEHIYWANPSVGFAGSGGTVGRANLDGSDVRDSFITADSSLGPGCGPPSSRCAPGSVAVSVLTGPLCLRQDPPPLPILGDAVFARPLDPGSSNANVVVLPIGSIWSEASPCGGIAQGAAEIVTHPTSIAVAPGAAVVLKDDTGLVSAWGAENVGAGDPAPIFFPGRPGRTPTQVEVVDAKTLLDTYNGCRACVLPEDISFTPAPANPNVAYWGDLSDARLVGATLTGPFTSWNLSGADLTGAVLSGTDLTGADLTGAVLSGATLAQTVVDRTVFDRADLRGTQLVGLQYTVPPSFSSVRIGPFDGRARSSRTPTSATPAWRRSSRTRVARPARCSPAAPYRSICSRCWRAPTRSPSTSPMHGSRPTGATAPALPVRICTALT